MVFWFSRKPSPRVTPFNKWEQLMKCSVASAGWKVREQNPSLLDVTSPHRHSTWTTSTHCICSSSEATKPCPVHLLIWSGVATVSTSQVQREWDTVRLRELPTVSHITTTRPGVQIQELFFTMWGAWPQKLCCTLLLLCSPPNVGCAPMIWVEHKMILGALRLGMN